MENENIKEETGGAVTAEVSDDLFQALDESIAKEPAAMPKYEDIEERETKLLAALDEVLEKRSKQFERPMVAPEPKVQKIAKGIANKGVGFVSLGLILIFLGIVMICLLFSKSPDYSLPLKLSPVCAILIGVEILCNHMIKHGRFKINYPSIIISALLVVGCCVLSAIYGNTATKRREEYTNRSIGAEIYDLSYQELRHSVDIESLEVDVDMNPDASRIIEGPKSLSTEDIVNIKVKFAGVFNTPKEFAVNCKKVIDGYRFMGISVTNFYFENESSLHSYKLNVEGKYAQDYSEDRLMEKVSHIYLDNMNYFEDLEDYVFSSEK